MIDNRGSNDQKWPRKVVVSVSGMAVTGCTKIACLARPLQILHLCDSTTLEETLSVSLASYLTAAASAVGNLRLPVPCKAGCDRGRVDNALSLVATTRAVAVLVMRAVEP